MNEEIEKLIKERDVWKAWAEAHLTEMTELRLELIERAKEIENLKCY